MTFQVGRFEPGADVFVQSFAWAGNGLRISGLTSSTQATALVQRQQILGLSGVVPLTYSPDPSIDGYYRVESSQVSLEKLPSGRYPWSMDLQRVPGFSSPQVDLVVAGALRVNAHLITTAAATVMAVPGSASEVTDTSTSSVTTFARTSADGALICSSSIDHERRLTYSVPPADFLVGAATIEIGDPLAVVVGEQIPYVDEDWRISNGLIRCELSASGFDLSCYDGTQWETARTLSLATDTSPVVTEVTTPLASGLRVLRNTPEAIVVRLPIEVPPTIATPYTGAPLYGYVDLMLRRGERMVRGFVACDGTAFPWSIGHETTQGATSLTGGIRRTGTDGGGNRWVVGSPDDFTEDLTEGRIQLTADQETFTFAMGFEVDGASAPANDAAQAILNQYFSAATETQRIVAR